MDTDEIRELRLAHPFKPFYLVLTDGRKLPVDQPYYLAVSPTRRFVVHSSVGGLFEVVRPDQVRAVDFNDVRREPSSPPPAGQRAVP